MQNVPVRRMHWIILSLSLNLVGCSGPTPAPPTEPRMPLIPEGIMPGSALTPQAPLKAPVNTGSGALAAPISSVDNPPMTAPSLTLPQAPGPIQAMQSPVLFEQMQTQIPGQIPYQSAAGQLFSLNSAQLANVQYPLTPFSGTTGYSYGAVPNMLNYGVYNNCLYYPYQGVWVPYTLQGNFYYPYVYASSALSSWGGYCVYPFLYQANGLYYPYFYYTNNYLYGFPDWEYNWPTFRSRHRDDDWERLNTHRRVGTRDFDHWRERGSRVKRRDSETPGEPEGPRPRRSEPQVSPPEVTPPDSRPLRAHSSVASSSQGTFDVPKRRAGRPREHQEP